MATRKKLLDRLQNVRCLLLDVDGVMTDGKLYFDADGREFKSFDVQDGLGLALARRGGLLVGFVPGRPTRATRRRAKELRVDILIQGRIDKGQTVAQVQKRHRLRAEEICFVGDDLLDLPALERVGLAIAVANAVPEVKRAAHYVTKRPGGNGAVREVAERLLKAQGSWKPR
jgi:3-deoxy-D-manno-octulosonate 8-phosphate phosphatase (KDO 8-P phosphatase)